MGLNLRHAGEAQVFQTEVAILEVRPGPVLPIRCLTPRCLASLPSSRRSILPVNALKDPERSPLRVLERLMGHRLA